MKSINYETQIRETALKKLKILSSENKQRIFRKIEELGSNPLDMQNVKKLVEFDISYSMRVGDYRILFERDDSSRIIDIIDIRNRRESYRKK
jgi:mRNA interferase RelE/StbE